MVPSKEGTLIMPTVNGGTGGIRLRTVPIHSFSTFPVGTTRAVLRSKVAAHKPSVTYQRGRRIFWPRTKDPKNRATGSSVRST
jgi:hypothetical protein